MGSGKGSGSGVEEEYAKDQEEYQDWEGEQDKDQVGIWYLIQGWEGWKVGRVVREGEREGLHIYHIRTNVQEFPD